MHDVPDLAVREVFDDLLDEVLNDNGLLPADVDYLTIPGTIVHYGQEARQAVINIAEGPPVFLAVDVQCLPTHDAIHHDTGEIPVWVAQRCSNAEYIMRPEYDVCEIVSGSKLLENQLNGRLIGSVGIDWLGYYRLIEGRLLIARNCHATSENKLAHTVADGQFQ